MKRWASRDQTWRIEPPMPGMLRIVLSLTAAVVVVYLSMIWSERGLYNRVGSLPYPGFLSLFELADPSVFLQAASVTGEPPVEPGPQRGIVYTEEAGFLDLAHVRNTIDLAIHFHKPIRNALLSGKERIFLIRRDSTDFYIEIDEGWQTSGLDVVATLVELNEAAISFSARSAEQVMMWHEIATWFGYRSTEIWSEKLSAFTFEDVMSHVIGARVAAQFLRDEGRSDGSVEVAARAQSAERALATELQSLGLVSNRLARRMLLQVENVWWSKDGPARRMIPWPGIAPQPWRIVDVGCPGQAATMMRGLRVVGTTREYLSNRAHLQLHPSEELILLLRPHLGFAKTLTSTRHFPVLLDAVRFDVRTKLGESALHPEDKFSPLDCPHAHLRSPMVSKTKRRQV